LSSLVENITCLHGGTCDYDAISCNCSLAIGYTGEYCEEAEAPCAGGRIQCLHGGNCSDSSDPPTCTCPAGYSGVTCSI